MNWETLPGWFWTIYYIFLLTTLGLAIFRVIKQKSKFFPLLVIVISLTTPCVTLINSIGRARGRNEFEHFLNQLQGGTFWSLFTILGHLFLVGSLFFFFIKSELKIKMQFEYFMKFKVSPTDILKISNQYDLMKTIFLTYLIQPIFSLPLCFKNVLVIKRGFIH
ncbi:hypothetical protein [Alkalihalobacillus sp. TS-13]|uniref:hypothetical protein n=1 Tax=Alkalihalobacillus sp. TS-13 TaxID=2842455 RepID=UPI0021A9A466|nr:hypothetical protein [Alkalihalobacillus sp. TS-13]